MSVEPFTPQELAELPVFPLPGAVLFPGATIGLHLFEPRYRAMMRHCLEHGPRAMAIAQLVPGHEVDYAGQPPIHEIAGAGRIVAHRANHDGTFDLELACIARVRLHELPFVTPFRRARAEALADVVARPEAIRELMALAAQLAPGTTETATPSELVDAIADRTVRDPATRQQLLETVDVQERIDLLVRALLGAREAADRWKRAN